MAAPLIIISGPSGVGKTTTTTHILEKMPFLQRTITVTTRTPRAGERHGIDYFFISSTAFDQLNNAQAFLEVNEFNGNYYATPRSLLTFLARNKPRIILPDVNGAIHLKKIISNVLAIWLDAPLNELAKRLAQRNTESIINQKERLSRAIKEMEEARNAQIYDYFITMDDYSAAEKKIAQYIYAAISTGSSSSSLEEPGILPISFKTV
jgi:guanylate kinase